jgi:hypothetical protein
VVDGPPNDPRAIHVEDRSSDLAPCRGILAVQLRNLANLQKLRERSNIVGHDSCWIEGPSMFKPEVHRRSSERIGIAYTVHGHREGQPQPNIDVAGTLFAKLGRTYEFGHPVPARLGSGRPGSEVESSRHKRLRQAPAQPAAAAAVGLTVGDETPSGSCCQVTGWASRTTEASDRVLRVALDHRGCARRALAQSGNGGRRVIGADSFDDPDGKRAEARVT